MKISISTLSKDKNSFDLLFFEGLLRIKLGVGTNPQEKDSNHKFKSFGGKKGIRITNPNPSIEKIFANKIIQNTNPSSE